MGEVEEFGGDARTYLEGFDAVVEALFILLGFSVVFGEGFVGEGLAGVDEEVLEEGGFALLACLRVVAGELKDAEAGAEAVGTGGELEVFLEGGDGLGEVAFFAVVFGDLAGDVFVFEGGAVELLVGELVGGCEVGRVVGEEGAGGVEVGLPVVGVVSLGAVCGELGEFMVEGDGFGAFLAEFVAAEELGEEVGGEAVVGDGGLEGLDAELAGDFVTGGDGAEEVGVAELGGEVLGVSFGKVLEGGGGLGSTAVVPVGVTEFAGEVVGVGVFFLKGGEGGEGVFF